MKKYFFKRDEAYTVAVFIFIIGMLQFLMIQNLQLDQEIKFWIQIAVSLVQVGLLVLGIVWFFTWTTAYRLNKGIFHTIESIPENKDFFIAGEAEYIAKDRKDLREKYELKVICFPSADATSSNVLYLVAFDKQKIKSPLVAEGAGYYKRMSSDYLNGIYSTEDLRKK